MWYYRRPRDQALESRLAVLCPYIVHLTERETDWGFKDSRPMGLWVIAPFDPEEMAWLLLVDTMSIASGLAATFHPLPRVQAQADAYLAQKRVRCT